MTKSEWKDLCNDIIDRYEDKISTMSEEPDKWKEARKLLIGCIREVDKLTHEYHRENKVKS